MAIYPHDEFIAKLLAELSKATGISEDNIPIQHDIRHGITVPSAARYKILGYPFRLDLGYEPTELTLKLFKKAIIEYYKAK